MIQAEGEVVWTGFDLRTKGGEADSGLGRTMTLVARGEMEDSTLPAGSSQSIAVTESVVTSQNTRMEKQRSQQKGKKTYIYIYIYRERERERRVEGGTQLYDFAPSELSSHYVLYNFIKAFSSVHILMKPH